MRSSETRKKILKTTFILLLENGFDAVSVSDIQNRLGISRGLLYRYFKGKSDLVFAACREYFYDRYFEESDYANMTLEDFLKRAYMAMDSITDFEGEKIGMLKYNTLYSSFIQRDERFRLVALQEFDKARKVIRNAIRRGEIKKLPENFVGATILAILGRTSYISATPSESHVKKRIAEDIEHFYALIKND